VYAVAIGDIVFFVDNVVHEFNVAFVNIVVSEYNVAHVYKALVNTTTVASCVYIVDIGLILYNWYILYNVYMITSDMLPLTRFRFTTMGCKDGIVLFLGGHRHGILALYL
jgi:hypothetical protein